uniref:RNase H type-1 domain-containing protein n=1 Tax=Cannabis sativa TaxID=3483 RepID=A0A803QIQ7_CANSA
MRNKILHIHRIPSPHHDQIIWKDNSNGKFSMKSAYCLDQALRFWCKQKFGTAPGLDLCRLGSKMALLIDASWSEEIMGAAAVMKTLSKDSLAYCLTNSSIVSALEAELKAILFALEWLLQNK